jgi:hypothetical protein
MNSFTLLNPGALILLVLVPFIVFFIGIVLPSKSVERAHSAVVIFLLVAFSCCGIFTLAEPTQEITVHSVAWKGNKVIGLLDVSGSESECYRDENVNGAYLPEPSSCRNAYDAFHDLFLQFIKQHPVDNFGLTTIDDEARTLVRLGDGNSVAIRKLLMLEPSLAGTNLRVGVQAALDQFVAKSEQRQFLLIMSDGQDQIKAADAAEVKRRISDLGVQVFFIKNAKRGFDDGDDLDKLVKDAGGAVFTVYNPEEMAAAFGKVSSKIQPESYTQTTVVAADLTIHYFCGTAVLFVLFAIAAVNIWLRKGHL